MRNIKDPITGSKNVKYIESIDLSNLINGYQKILNIDINYLLNTSEVSLYKSIETGYEFYYPPIMGDSKFYQALENYPWYYAKNKWEHKVGIEMIQDGTTLEIGCGSGEFLNKIKLKGIECQGLDFNQNAINIAKEKGLNVHATTIKEFIKNNKGLKFDNIVLFQILEHIFDVKDFFSDVVELLNKNGQVLIAVPNNSSLVFNLKDDTSYSIDAHLLNMPPHHAGKWNKNSLTQLAKYFNLNVNKVFYEPIYEARLGLITDVLIKKYVPFLKNNLHIKEKVLRMVIKNKKKFKGDTILVSISK